MLSCTASMLHMCACVPPVALQAEDRQAVHYTCALKRSCTTAFFCNFRPSAFWTSLLYGLKLRLQFFPGMHMLAEPDVDVDKLFWIEVIIQM